MTRGLAIKFIICIILSNIVGFASGWLINWNDDSTSTTTSPNPCLTFPPLPQCIPPGFTVIAPDGREYIHGVAK